MVERLHLFNKRCNRDEKISVKSTISRIVTIEGINSEQLNPIQQALVNNGAIQCGFCTPGLVMALTGFFLNNSESSERSAIDAVAGNLCRCTGYSGIKRAIKQLCSQIDLSRSLRSQRVDDLIQWQIFRHIFQPPLEHYYHCHLVIAQIQSQIQCWLPAGLIYSCKNRNGYNSNRYII
jgi:hypothetical protein